MNKTIPRGAPWLVLPVGRLPSSAVNVAERLTVLLEHAEWTSHTNAAVLEALRRRDPRVPLPRADDVTDDLKMLGDSVIEALSAARRLLTAAQERPADEEEDG